MFSNESIFQDETYLTIVKGTGKESTFAESLCQILSTLPRVILNQPITEEQYKNIVVNDEAGFRDKITVKNGMFIFFGKGKEISAQAKAIKIRFAKYGMTYGWLGNRGFVSADPSAITKDNISEFNAFYENNYERIKPIINTALQNAKLGDKKADIWKRQYELVISLFVLDGFAAYAHSASKERKDKGITIIYNEKNSIYSHLLANMIFEYTDYQAAERTEKIFSSNGSSIASTNKLLFLGNTKAAKERNKSISFSFNKYGMKYGQIVNHAFIEIAKLTNKNERDDFVKYYIRESNKYIKFAMNKSGVRDSLLFELPAIGNTDIRPTDISFTAHEISRLNSEYYKEAPQIIEEHKFAKDIELLQYKNVYYRFVFDEIGTFMGE